jgi:hypothetical protein
MAPLRDPVRVTRRSLLRIGGGLAAALAAGSVWIREASAVRRGGFFNPNVLIPVKIYYLSPDCSSIQCADQTELRHSCNSCNACRNHARNKRWASAEAVRRAHDCCRCTVKSTYVLRGIHEGMFGTGASFRPEFDYRSLL